jgi:Zn-dependent protease with chaperone function
VATFTHSFHEKRNANDGGVMSAWVWRRCAVSVSALLGLFVLVSGLVVVWTPIPLVVPVAISAVWVVAQYLAGPWIVSHLIRADEIERTPDGYDTDHEIAAIVARQCDLAGVPRARLGIVDDGTPNAFTFGRTQRDARIYVSRGLLERLDQDELEAVVAHEVGHVAQRDFIVMTLASIIPMVLYYIAVGARSNNRADGVAVAVVAYVGYFLAELAVLALGRARELGADHASCARTGHGDALCSALVKIAYGMGQVDQERASEVRALIKDKQRKDARRLVRQGHRTKAVGALGIADPGLTTTLIEALGDDNDPADALGAMRWESSNPWGRFSEKLSSHPLVIHRIAALESSGLPGAPTNWPAEEVMARPNDEEIGSARWRFGLELPIRYLGGLLCVVAFLMWKVAFHQHQHLLGEILCAAGILLFIRALMRTPLTGFDRVDRVTTLLTRLDAGPVSGMPVRIRGKVIGRGVPGYVLSPDLVVADDSGFIPVLYSQPLPFARGLFALARAGTFAEREVVVRGWYRREYGPAIELQSVEIPDEFTTKSWQYVARIALAVVIAVVGAGLAVL